MTQQTAVEWLYERFLFAGYAAPSEWKEQAKQMEKRQIIKAHGDKGWAKPIIDDNGIPKKDGIAFGTTTGEQYYNETYERKS